MVARRRPHRNAGALDTKVLRCYDANTVSGPWTTIMNYLEAKYDVFRFATSVFALLLVFSLIQLTSLTIFCKAMSSTDGPPLRSAPEHEISYVYEQKKTTQDRIVL